VAEAGSRLDILDGTSVCETIDVDLAANLTAEQIAATEALVVHDLGTLVGPPGSGKTVVGCAVISHHKQVLRTEDRTPVPYSALNLCR
jgi:superfamily II DNA or RNA helicase